MLFDLNVMRNMQLMEAYQQAKLQQAQAELFAQFTEAVQNSDKATPVVNPVPLPPIKQLMK